MKDRYDLIAYGLIVGVVTLASIPALTSGDRLNANNDFFQYASRHEAVRKSVVEYHTWPLRSHWLGGGYPTLGDPEDATLNPLVLLSALFGPVMGLKLIGYLALLVGGLSTYALGRHVLGYTRWGALFSGLVFGCSLFVPLRIQDGNPNEVYAAFLPLCLLLIGLVCRGRKFAIVVLPFVFYTMLSDGKLTYFMAMLFVGVLCLMALVPPLDSFGERRVDYRPLKFFLLALGLTFLLGMARILPAQELINHKGGLGNIDLFYHPKTYRPEGVFAYEFDQLWQELVGWRGRTGLVTIGWIPVTLTGIALLAFWRRTLAWGVNLLLFSWLILAHNAGFDLLKLLWHLPIFSALYRPYKYFSFQIAFTFAVVAGHCFVLLKQLRPRWLEHLIAVVLVGFSLGFLYPAMTKIQRETYRMEMPELSLTAETEFFNVQGQGLERSRKEPISALAYFNLLRNVGTVDWYTGIPIEENAIPKYFVDKTGKEIPNPAYRGEAFLLEGEGAVDAVFQPNSIALQVTVRAPAILIVNQNYHRAWRTSRGELFNRDGLLALRLSDVGDFTISLRYVPVSFYAGLVVSLITLLGLAFVCWAYTTGRFVRWAKSPSTLVRHVSVAVLWLVR